MFFRILGERKRREFDPALQAIRGLVAEAGATGAVRGRLEQMADLLGTVEGVVSRFVQDPQSSRAALAFVAGRSFAAKARGRRT
jgi:hypothetical protein